jgi:hypothetical protein
MAVLVANTKIATKLSPFSRDWFRKVVPDYFQETEASFRIVKQHAHNIVSAVETNAQIYLSHKALVTNEFWILNVLGCFQRDGTATAVAFRNDEEITQLNVRPMWV